MNEFWQSGFLFSKFYTSQGSLKGLVEMASYLLNIFSSPLGFIYYNHEDGLNILFFGRFFFLILMILGIYSSIIKKNRHLIFFCVLPLLLHFILNLLQLYPIQKRINLYQFPLIIILILEGIRYFVNKGPLLKSFIKVSTIIFLLSIAVNVPNQFPHSIDNTKEVLNYLNSFKNTGANEQILMVANPKIIDYYSKQEKYFQITSQISFSTIEVLESNSITGKYNWLYINPIYMIGKPINQVTMNIDTTYRPELLYLYRINK